MIQRETNKKADLLEYVRHPPPIMERNLQLFYSIYDGIDLVIGEWYCPKLELPHLLMLDLNLNRFIKDRQEWVSWRITTLSIAQHIIVNANDMVWNPLDEYFADFAERSMGDIKAIRTNNDLTSNVWRTIWSDTCFPHL